MLTVADLVGRLHPRHASRGVSPITVLEAQNLVHGLADLLGVFSGDEMWLHHQKLAENRDRGYARTIMRPGHGFCKSPLTHASLSNRHQEGVAVIGKR